MTALCQVPRPDRDPRPFAIGLALALMIAGTVRGAAPSLAGPSQARVRRPVALAFSRDGDRLFVANERSGSLSVVDPIRGSVVGEHDLGRGLAGVVRVPGAGSRLLAVDQAGDSLLLLEDREDTVRVVARLPVSPDPVAVVVADDGTTCVVASRWSRRLTFLELDDKGTGNDAALTEKGILELPFSPRQMALIPRGPRLVVADAFGGKLAVVDPGRRVLESVRTLRAHNIRGMALTPDGRSLLLAHQVLSTPARTTQEDVQWGGLLNNHVRSLDLELLLAPGPQASPIDEARQGTRGEMGRGTGDPGSIAWTPRGEVIVALSGVDQVAIGTDPFELHRRVPVGRRPTAVATSPDGRIACVADTLDDAVSVIDVGSARRIAQVSLGTTPETSREERGERLFFDARLSRGGWMSCQSCHTDGHSNGLSVDTFGDRAFGAPKRVPSLLGTGDTAPWGWKGPFARLEAQVHESTVSTMHGTFPTEEEVAELAAYLQTLSPPRIAAPASRDGSAIARGRSLFIARCAECHAPPSYTSSGRYDVGLSDESGETEFNPPSLRGVGLRTPLLHDGRAETIEEVLGKFGHPPGRGATPREISDLVEFLRTL